MSLNRKGITKVTAVTGKTILYDIENQFSLSCKVSGSAGTTIKAGTPLKGDLLNRDTAFSAASASDTPVGILLHDTVIDADNNPANASVLIFGFVDVSKLEQSVVTVLNDAMKSKLPKITFCK